MISENDTFNRQTGNLFYILYIVKENDPIIIKPKYRSKGKS